jgi:hypothetical protein
VPACSWPAQEATTVTKVDPPKGVIQITKKEATHPWKNASLHAMKWSFAYLVWLFYAAAL